MLWTPRYCARGEGRRLQSVRHNQKDVTLKAMENCIPVMDYAVWSNGKA